MTFEEILSRVLYEIVCPIFICIGIGGNILSLLIFSRKCMPKTSSLQYLVSLSSINIIVLLLFIPHTFLRQIKLNNSIRQFLVPLTNSLLIAMRFITVAVAFDRYITISHFSSNKTKQVSLRKPVTVLRQRFSRDQSTLQVDYHISKNPSNKPEEKIASTVLSPTQPLKQSKNFSCRFCHGQKTKLICLLIILCSLIIVWSCEIGTYETTNFCIGKWNNIIVECGLAKRLSNLYTAYKRNNEQFVSRNEYLSYVKKRFSSAHFHNQVISLEKKKKINSFFLLLANHLRTMIATTQNNTELINSTNIFHNQFIKQENQFVAFRYKYYFVIHMLIGFFIPFICLLILNSMLVKILTKILKTKKKLTIDRFKTSKKLQQSTNNVKNNIDLTSSAVKQRRSESKITLTLVLIVVLLLVSSIPKFYLNLKYLLVDRRFDVSYERMVADYRLTIAINTTATVINSSVNFLLYSFLGRNFVKARKEVFENFKNIFLCTKKSVI
ncbi:hypothetical protein SNEBB_006887 [Seison nebaliae]|nr:hypothetical protein SNEBB_006887 [Seison nebaliae]